MNGLRQYVKKYIESNRLCGKDDRIVVGISGGADSVALLRILRYLKYDVEAAHCNFQLRGAESDRDEAFVTRLCEELDIVLHVRRFDTLAYASERKVSVEMAARDLRYDWFRQLLKERRGKVIAIAHHREDNAETVLLNLIRGTGIAGLCGMQPKNGDVIRPLLDVSRADIEDYLRHIRQSFITDSTNLEDHCVRNKIRLNILPEMQSINPSVVSSIVETATRLNEAKRLVDKQMDSAEVRCKLPLDAMLNVEGCKINIHQLQIEVSPRLLLYKILSPFGFNSTQIAEIYRSLNGDAGKLFESSKGWTLLKDRNFLFVRKNGVDLMERTGKKELLIDMASIRFPADLSWNTLRFRIELLPYSADFVISHKKSCAYLDVDKLSSQLYVRHWKRGDRFTPFGMKGTKLVSDYMTDCKFSLFQKEAQCVLVDKSDRIIWLVGERIDDNYKVDKNTTKMLLIEFLGI